MILLTLWSIRAFFDKACFVNVRFYSKAVRLYYVQSFGLCQITTLKQCPLENEIEIKWKAVRLVRLKGKYVIVALLIYLSANQAFSFFGVISICVSIPNGMKFLSNKPIYITGKVKAINIAIVNPMSIYTQL